MKTFRKIRIPNTECKITLKDDDGYLFLEIIDEHQADIPGGHGIIILPPEAVKVLIQALEDFDTGQAGEKLEQRIKERYGEIEDVKLCDWWTTPA